jgi:hypothetical protein
MEIMMITKEGLTTAALAPVGLVWMLASPITYLLCIVDTWHWPVSVYTKLVMNVTIDALASTFWPGTWVFWLIASATGHHTPLGLLH